MAIPLTGPISFGDLNDEIGNNTNDTLDLIQAGLDFGFSPGAPGLGGTWEDAVPGLSLSEFRGQDVNTGLANSADFTDIGSGYTLTLQGTPSPSGEDGSGTFNQYTLTQPGTVYPAGNPASLLTAGPHSLPTEITSDGTYVITNPSTPLQGVINPTAGGVEETITVNPHGVSVPALPAYQYEEFSQIPAPLQLLSSPGGVNRGTVLVYDQYFTPDSGPVFLLERMNFTSLYNDKTLAQNPTPVPYNPGTYQVSTIDWKFNTYFSVGTQGPANPLPNTNTSIVTGQAVGSTNLQSPTNNFLRTGVNVTVNYNNSTSPRQTYVYAFVPTGPQSATWGLEMNRNGNEFNSFYDGYYYPIPVIQDGSPVDSNTLTTSPHSVTFDYSGGTTSPITINVTPNQNSYTYNITGPGAPAFTLNSLSSPQTGDDTFTITAPINGGGPRTANLEFTHPGGITPLPITQTGVDVGISGYPASASPGTTYNRSVGFGATTLPAAIQTTPTSIPWTAAVLPSPTPFLGIPTTNGTGPSPTFQVTFPQNNNQTTRTQQVEFDFNVGGNPYITTFNITQGAAPLPIVNIPAGSNRTIPFNGGSTQCEVFANEPFSVNFSSPSPKLTINPTSTNFSSSNPGGALVPYTFTITGTANPIYDPVQSTFTVNSPIFPNPNQSPVGPISYTQTLNGNPADVVIAWNPSSPIGPAFSGAWTYLGPSGLNSPSSGGTVTANVQAYQFSTGALISGVPFTVNLTAPNPAVNTGQFPFVSTSGTRSSPGTVSMTLPSNPSGTLQRSYYVYLTSPAPIGSSPVPGIQQKFTAEFSISTSQIVAPQAGSPVSRGLTANVPWSVPSNPAPWLTVSPTSGAGPATISFDATAIGSSDRSTNVTFTSPQGGPKTIPVVQYAPEPDSFSIPTTPATIPHTGASSTPRSLTTTPASLPWGPITSPAPWISVSVGPTGSGPATVSFSAPSSPGTYRSTIVTFNNPVSAVDIPVAQPAPPVPDSLTISPTNITLPYSIGFGETISATGAGIFNKINETPWIEVSPSGPASAPAPFTINALSANPSPSPRVGSVDISHPANSYTITVTQEGEPTPQPTPQPTPCIGVSVRVSNSSSTSACNSSRYNLHYFDNQFINAANEYYGTSTNCSTLRSGEYWVADSGNTWARFFNGVFQEAGFCGGGGFE